MKSIMPRLTVKKSNTFHIIDSYIEAIKKVKNQHLLVFYVQDERYVMVRWPFLGIPAFTALIIPCMSTAKSDDVQDER